LELSPTYIHAAWQITLEAQRKVLASLEPAQSLEMLLLNLTYLPHLLRLEDVPYIPANPASQPSPIPPLAKQSKEPAQLNGTQDGRQRNSPTQHAAENPQTGGSSGYQQVSSVPAHAARAQESNPAPPQPPAPATPSGLLACENHKNKSWEGFLEYYDQLCRNNQACLPGLRQVECVGEKHGLTLRCRHQVQYNALNEPQKWKKLENLVQEYFGMPIPIRLIPPAETTAAPSKEEASPDKHPLVQEFVEHFNAKVIFMEPPDM
jgi:DNA polymerase III subunit gamma/tau